MQDYKREQKIHTQDVGLKTKVSSVEKIMDVVIDVKFKNM